MGKYSRYSPAEKGNMSQEELRVVLQEERDRTPIRELYSPAEMANGCHKKSSKAEKF